MYYLLVKISRFSFYSESCRKYTFYSLKSRYQGVQPNYCHKITPNCEGVCSVPCNGLVSLTMIRLLLKIFDCLFQLCPSTVEILALSGSWITSHPKSSFLTLSETSDTKEGTPSQVKTAFLNQISSLLQGTLLKEALLTRLLHMWCMFSMFTGVTSLL